MRIYFSLDESTRSQKKRIFKFAGLTGGLAAPLVAGSIGVLIGSGALAGLATTAGAAVLGTTFGVAGAGLAGYKVGAFQFFLNEEKIRSNQKQSSGLSSV